MEYVLRLASSLALSSVGLMTAFSASWQGRVGSHLRCMSEVSRSHGNVGKMLSSNTKRSCCLSLAFKKGNPTNLIISVLLVAIPSGVGVALSVLGANTNSLVGVAISASLLPPAVNTGSCFAYCIIMEVRRVTSSTQILGNANNTFAANGLVFCLSLELDTSTRRVTQLTSCNRLLGDRTLNTGDVALIGLYSFFLCIANIVCIIVMGVAMFKVKEVYTPSKVGTINCLGSPLL